MSQKRKRSRWDKYVIAFYGPDVYYWNTKTHQFEIATDKLVMNLCLSTKAHICNIRKLIVNTLKRDGFTAEYAIIKRYNRDKIEIIRRTDA